MPVTNKILSILVLILFGWAVYAQIADPDEPQGIKKYFVGEMAGLTEFSSASLFDGLDIILADGSVSEISDMSDKVLLVNLWASWCAPCRAEMKELANLQKELGDARFEVVAVNVDRGGIAQARDVLAEWGIEGLGLYADPSFDIAFKVANGALPTSFIVDRAGRVRAKYVGPLKWDAPDAVALFKALKENKL